MNTKIVTKIVNKYNFNGQVQTIAYKLTEFCKNFHSPSHDGTIQPNIRGIRKDKNRSAPLRLKSLPTKKKDIESRQTCCKSYVKKSVIPKFGS